MVQCINFVYKLIKKKKIKKIKKRVGTSRSGRLPLEEGDPDEKKEKVAVKAWGNVQQ